MYIQETEENERAGQAWSADLFSRLHIPNLMDQRVPHTIPDYYTAPFRLDKVEMFLGSQDKETFFSPSQRSRLVLEVLNTTTFGMEKKGEIGIDRLINEGAFTAAYPLHDVNKDYRNILLCETSLSVRAPSTGLLRRMLTTRR